MRTARPLLMAVAVLAPLLLVATPAHALTVPGVTASPNPASPGDLITIQGPAIVNEPPCLNGTLVFTGGGRSYRFGTTTLMSSAWSVTSNEFRQAGTVVQVEPGTYSIGIDCFDDRGNQSTHQTTLTVTIAAPNPTAYRGVTPARLYDTRPGAETIDGVGAGGGAVGPGGVRTVKVTGRGGVPTAEVKAVVLNVTSTGASGPGFVTVYPTGESRPLASNLNFGPGQTVANLVVSKLGVDGQVNLYNDTGSSHLIVDVAGWFPSAATFTPLSPARLLDTRPGQTTVDNVAAGGGAVGPGGVMTLRVTGRAGVPASGVGAVILNVTAVGPDAPSFVTVYPSGEPRPLASNLNFVPGQTVPNLVMAKVGADGNVILYNSTGSTHLIADVAGWFPTSSSYRALTPVRVLDTRPGQTTVDNVAAGAGAVGPRQVLVLQLTGRGGLPPSGVDSVVLNLTAVAPTSAGFVTVFPTGGNRPLASNLNFAPGQTVANLVVAKVGPSGQVSIFNDSGSTHLVADVAGWFAR